MSLTEACGDYERETIANHRNCLSRFEDVGRLAFIGEEGANPFTGASAAAQKTNIETKTKWDDAILLADPADNLTLTGFTQGGSFPKEITGVTALPNGDNALNSKMTVVRPTFTFFGVTHEDYDKMMAYNGRSAQVLFIDKFYNTTFRKVDNGTASPFFVARNIAVSSVGSETGGQLQSVDIAFDIEFDWYRYGVNASTSAFAGII